MVFETDGVKVHYEISGEGGRPLALLHGWGCDIGTMSALLRDMSSDRRVLALDFPGHGDSSEPPEAWSVTEYMNITLALMKSAGFTGADIIAHSFGGRVALLMAAEHPEMVGRLLLTGCAGIPPKSDARKSARSRRYSRLKKLADNALTRAVFGKKVDIWREELVQKYGSSDYKALSKPMRATFNRVLAQDLTGCLARISAPTRLVWGTEDTATPIWMGETMASKIPGASLIRFQGCGHFAFTEQYARFLAIAREFFK